MTDLQPSPWSRRARALGGWAAAGSEARRALTATGLGAGLGLVVSLFAKRERRDDDEPARGLRRFRQGDR